MILSPGKRIWAYGVTAAGLLVGGVYGIVDGQQTAAWMALAAAVLGLAIVNVPAPAVTPPATTPPLDPAPELDDDAPPPRRAAA